MHSWAIEEVVLRPAATLLLSGLVPFATAALLRLILLGRPADDPESRARQLAPLRQAAMIVGIAQLELAWIAGSSALGPALVPTRDGWESNAFGAACFAITFVAGGLARRPEEPVEARSTILGTAMLRLRMLAFLAGPVVGAFAVLQLPLIGSSGEQSVVRWPWVAIALVGCVFGVAYGGLVAGMITGALRPASPSLRSLARDVARAEGTRLWLVLRLPTRGSRFANAAALPWARAMVVSDALVELLEPDELRAVLAHEAGHLSEPAAAAVLRLGTAGVFVFALTAGVEIAVAGGADPWMSALGALALVLPGFIAMRRFARRMEIRADARACATVGPEPLARALSKLHRALLLPSTTGARRVHPDLYDRLAACGRELGERPAPPPRRIGALTGVVVALSVIAAPFAAEATTEIAPTEVADAGDGAARWRLRVDPWDATAMLAAGWAARSRGEYERALSWARDAGELGAAEGAALELTAEVQAARGDCEAARATFDRALAARMAAVFADPLTTRISLGGYRLPPSLVTECGGVSDP